MAGEAHALAAAAPGRTLRRRAQAVLGRDWMAAWLSRPKDATVTWPVIATAVPPRAMIAQAHRGSKSACQSLACIVQRTSRAAQLDAAQDGRTHFVLPLYLCSTY